MATCREVRFEFLEDVPDLAFEKARIIYNFGADFLETWGRPVENARRLSESNAFDGKTKTELVHLSPHVSSKAPNSDRCSNRSY